MDSQTPASNQAEADRFWIPDTVSPEASAGLAGFFGMVRQMPAQQRPASQADWDNQNEHIVEMLGPVSQQFATSLGVGVRDDVMGGVPVVRVTPADPKPGARKIIYLHGGAYTFGAAKTTLGLPAVIASAMGNEVISVDYTLAPRANWRTITDQVVAVWKALLEAGANSESVGVFGESAGGGLVAGSVLKMRDQGLRLPGALYLISPWTDTSMTGDTWTTLRAFDPAITVDLCAWSAAAYRDDADAKNPAVSPVYGDYAQPFPPTLIQVGTREMLLSDSVRLYQAMRSAGREAVLDVYEGMTHAFPGLLAQAPETKIAISRGAEFLDAHLLS